MDNIYSLPGSGLSILAIVNFFHFSWIPNKIYLFSRALGYVATYRSSSKDVRLLRTNDRVGLGSVVEGRVVSNGQIVCIYTQSLLCIIIQ